MERKNDDLKYSAILHGADPEKLEEKNDEVNNKEKLLFGDPEEYKKWTDEERNEATLKMEQKFKKWAKGTQNG